MGAARRLDFVPVAILALRPVHVGPVAALCLACAACGATLVLLPSRPPRLSSVGAYPWWDLPLRAACAVIPIVAVTSAARALGPHLSGLLASFPIITPVLAAFTQAQQGKDEVVRLLHGMTIGFFSYALFCFVVSVTVRGLGIAASFALATALALAAAGRGDRAQPPPGAAGFGRRIECTADAGCRVTWSGSSRELAS